MSAWTCQRVTDGSRCRHVNPSIKRKCESCGKARPPRRKPAHMTALGLDYDGYVKLNGGDLCGVCGRESSSNRKLDRDHDHANGQPRGLLCHRCNRTLAPWVTQDWLKAAAAYLGRAA